MSLNMAPGGINTDTFTPDGLVAAGRITTLSVTLKQDTAATATSHVRGRLLNIDAAGTYHAIDKADAGKVTITGEAIGTDVGTSLTEFVKVLTKPPLPGTVSIYLDTAASTAANDIVLGTDNGKGIGIGTGGSFEVDYETGRVSVHLAVVATASTDDLKATFQHLAIDAAAATKTIIAMPKAVLAEDIAAADLIAGDVVTVAYVGGEFNPDYMYGYVSEYEAHLNDLGMRTRSAG